MRNKPTSSLCEFMVVIMTFCLQLMKTMMLKIRIIRTAKINTLFHSKDYFQKVFHNLTLDYSNVLTICGFLLCQNCLNTEKLNNFAVRILDIYLSVILSDLLLSSFRNGDGVLQASGLA